MAQKCNRLFVLLSIISLISFSANVAQAGSATSVFNFSANFLGGSCEISVPASLRFNNGDVIMPSEIFNVDETGTPKVSAEFNLRLLNCAGQGLQPKIKVSGNIELICGSSLYKNNTTGAGSAAGYGVLLRTSGNGTFNANNNIAFNNNITLKSWSKDSRLESLTGSTLPIVAVLRTGSCSNDARRGGEFMANVTFDFIYE